MTRDFRVGLANQEEWSWLVAIDLFLSGLGGALFVLFEIFSLGRGTAVLSLVLVVLGAVVLLTELGRPLRAWRAIWRPQSSWITRGVIFVTLFLVCGALYIAPRFAFLSWLPWGVDSSADKILGLLAGVAAFLVMLYPGFVLSASPAISLWNNALLPLLFISYSVMGACGVVLLLSAVGFLAQ